MTSHCCRNEIRDCWNGTLGARTRRRRHIRSRCGRGHCRCRCSSNRSYNHKHRNLDSRNRRLKQHHPTASPHSSDVSAPDQPQRHPAPRPRNQRAARPGSPVRAVGNRRTDGGRVFPFPGRRRMLRAYRRGRRRVSRGSFPGARCIWRMYMWICRLLGRCLVLIWMRGVVRIVLDKASMKTVLKLMNSRARTHNNTRRLHRRNSSTHVSHSPCRRPRTPSTQTGPLPPILAPDEESRGDSKSTSRRPCPSARNGMTRSDGGHGLGRFCEFFLFPVWVGLTKGLVELSPSSHRRHNTPHRRSAPYQPLPLSLPVCLTSRHPSKLTGPSRPSRLARQGCTPRSTGTTCTRCCHGWSCGRWIMGMRRAACIGREWGLFIRRCGTGVGGDGGGGRARQGLFVLSIELFVWLLSDCIRGTSSYN